MFSGLVGCDTRGNKVAPAIPKLGSCCCGKKGSHAEKRASIREMESSEGVDETDPAEAATVSVSGKSSAFNARSPSEDDDESQLRIPVHVRERAISHAVGLRVTRSAAMATDAGEADM